LGDVRTVILAISEDAKRIRGGFIGRQGSAGTKNVYGETQLEMDKWADELIVDDLKELPCVASIASEERDDLVKCSPNGTISVTLDPLDGSSLMGVNLSVGTIVGIFRAKDPLRPGSELAAAMYVLYGPLTTLVYTAGHGVHEFALDGSGEYVLQMEDIKIGSGKIYAPGALRPKWLGPHRRFIERLEEKGYKLRFCGSFVADAHQILHKGGIFTYPAYQGGEDGKLRLLFEANPIGFIIMNAGGETSNGRTGILSMKPAKLDQRVPVYVGGREEISMLHEEMNRE